MTEIEIEQTLTGPQFDFVVSDAKFPAIVAGFGAGKTEALIARLLKPKFDHPELNVAYYAPTYDLIRLIAWPRVEEKLNEWHIPYMLNKSENRMVIPGAGSIIFRTLDNPARIVGYEVSDSVVDELDTLKPDLAQEAWNKIIARNRQKKKNKAPNTVSVATTPEGYRFTYQRWKKAPVAGYELIHASTHSNAANLPPDYIETLESSYPGPLLSAYLDGQFVNMTAGSVYFEFDRFQNNSGATIHFNEPLHIGMDFNVLKMAAVVHVIRDNLPIAVDEVTNGRDTPYMIELFRQRYEGHHITIYPDASGGSASSKGASVSDISLLRQAGFAINAPSSNPPVRDRVISMNAMFCNALGQRRYRVNVQKCPTYTEALEQQAYDKNGEPDKGNDLDHHPDAGGYFIHRRYPVIRRMASQEIVL